MNTETTQLQCEIRFKWVFIALAVPLIMLRIRVPDWLINPFIKVEVK